MTGLSIKDSALAAGCPQKSAAQAGSRLEKHPNVLAHLARLKSVESDAIPTAGRDVSPPGVTDLEFYEDPKELLRAAMNDRLLDIKMRLQAATALLPYEHRRLGEGGKKEKTEEAAQEVVQGRFAPAAPPPQLKLIR